MRENFILETIGASASGKTTLVEERFKKEIAEGSVVNINRDEIRFELFTGGVRDWSKYKFNKANEKQVTDVQEQKIQKAIADRKDIIISDTNLNPNTRNRWKQLGEEHGYQLISIHFDVDWDTLVKRNAQRYGGVNEALLWSMFKRKCLINNVYPSRKENIRFAPYEHIRSLPETIIVDIDGTVASMEGIRRPFEWDKVHLDLPRREVIEMLHGLTQTTRDITFMSGRSGECFDSTYQWLNDNVMTDELRSMDVQWRLVMREADDQRKDDIVKYELYEKHVRGKFNVRAVIDDRPQVIRLWSVVGLPNIISVGQYGVEF